jgi:hypothetical protein
LHAFIYGPFSPLWPQPGAKSGAGQGRIFLAGILFSGFWALAHGLWVVAVGLFVGSGVLMGFLMLTEPAPITELAISLGYAVLIGFIANDLRRWTLEKRDYDLVGVVSGAGIDGAERRFLDNEPEKAAAVYS